MSDRAEGVKRLPEPLAHSPSAKAPGRPRDLDKARAILDAGWALFLTRGFEGTAVEAVAAAAGVSKVTLYKHFPDKTALFEAAVLREMERIEAAQAGPSPPPPPEAAPLAETLRGFGRGLMAYLATGPAVDFYAVLAGELRRHPRLARAFWDLGPGRTRANLAAVLAAAHAAGEIDAPDPEVAAEALFGLWQGMSNFQLALAVDLDAFQAGLDARVDEGVSRFLRAYARDPLTPPPSPAVR